MIRPRTPIERERVARDGARRTAEAEQETVGNTFSEGFPLCQPGVRPVGVDIAEPGEDHRARLWRSLEVFCAALAAALDS
jgi:hypothetical protein